MKKWECTVCGYIHTGPEPPDECPVCGADKSQFVEVTEPEEEAAAAETSDGAPEEAENGAVDAGGADGGADRKWECTVCGYIHTGPEPPDECPVCGADKSQFVEVTESAEQPSEPAAETASAGATAGAGEDGPRSESARQSGTSQRVLAGVDVDKLVSRVTEKMTELHAHPISVHIPNGVLPVSVLFLALAGLFGSRSLDTAAFCNLVIVLLSMPLVLFSGYNDWQRRYGGRLTQVFKVKIACGAVVTLTALILVVWWIAQPAVLFTPGAGRWVFFLIALAMLAAAATAGYYGGKLVFFYMSDKKK